MADQKVTPIGGNPPKRSLEEYLTDAMEKIYSVDALLKILRQHSGRVPPEYLDRFCHVSIELLGEANNVIDRASLQYSGGAK